MTDTTMQDAKEFRNFLAKLIRSGEIARSAEYDALDDAIHAACAPKPVIHTHCYQLPVAAAMWAADAKEISER